jgi:hypothetical protein
MSDTDDMNDYDSMDEYIIDGMLIPETPRFRAVLNALRLHAKTEFPSSGIETKRILDSGGDDKKAVARSAMLELLNGMPHGPQRSCPRGTG